MKRREFIWKAGASASLLALTPQLSALASPSRSASAVHTLTQLGPQVRHGGLYLPTINQTLQPLFSDWLFNINPITFCDLGIETGRKSDETRCWSVILGSEEERLALQIWERDNGYSLVTPTETVDLETSVKEIVQGDQTFGVCLKNFTETTVNQASKKHEIVLLVVDGTISIGGTTVSEGEIFVSRSNGYKISGNSATTFVEIRRQLKS